MAHGSFQRLRVYDHRDREAGRHDAGAVAKSLHLIHMHMSERALTVNHSKALETSVPTSSDTPLNKTTPSNPSQTFPPTGDQAFKYMSYDGQSYSNQHRKCD